LEPRNFLLLAVQHIVIFCARPSVSWSVSLDSWLPLNFGSRPTGAAVTEGAVVMEGAVAAMAAVAATVAPPGQRVRPGPALPGPVLEIAAAVPEDGTGSSGDGTGSTGEGTGSASDGDSASASDSDSASASDAASAAAAAAASATSDAAAASAATDAATATTTTTTANDDQDAPANTNNTAQDPGPDPPAIAVAPTIDQNNPNAITVTPELAAIEDIATTDPRGGFAPEDIPGAGLANLAVVTTIPPGGLPPPGALPENIEIHAVIISAAQSPWDVIKRAPGVGTITVIGGIVALGKTPIPDEIPGGGPQPDWLRLSPDLRLLNGSMIPPVVPNIMDIRWLNCPIKVEGPNP
jgi:hypothetical protein